MVWATRWFAQAVLGLAEPASAVNGSGDRTFDFVQLLVCAIVAAIGAIAWSALARRRSYPRLAAAAHVVLRYDVAYAMLSYGLSKVLRQQFGDLTPHELGQGLGDISPMGLLWRFMGYSAPYTVFGGLCEAIPGVLLLWRRTAAIGAVVVIAVMTNVVMLNLSYDVPVKLYSAQLLVMAARPPRSRPACECRRGASACARSPRPGSSWGSRWGCPWSSAGGGATRIATSCTAPGWSTRSRPTASSIRR
jgi:hypothetical protein